MKPTYQTKSQLKRIKSERGIARARAGLSGTTCSFQSSSCNLPHSASKTDRGGHVFDAPEFRSLSDEFLGTESRRNYIVDAVLFTILIVVSTWPIVEMGAAIAKWIK